MSNQGPQSSPRPVLIAGTSNLTGLLQNMDDPGWECYYDLQSEWNKSLIDPTNPGHKLRPITQTQVMDVDGTNVTHFYVEMREEDYNLLVLDDPDLIQKYYWNIRAGQPGDPYQTLKTDIINVGLIYSTLDVEPVGQPAVSDSPTAYTPTAEAAATLSSGVMLPIMEVQRSATGEIDPATGLRTAVHMDELFEADEVNRINLERKTNAQLLHDHVSDATIHGASTPGPGGVNPSGLIGDGVASVLTFTHNLGTLAYSTSVQEVATGEMVDVGVVQLAATAVIGPFQAVPAVDSYRVITG